MKIWMVWAVALALGGGAAGMAGTATPRVQAEEWVLQHQQKAPAGLSWLRLGEAYLGKTSWRDLASAQAPRAASRLVIGERKSPAAARVLAELGFHPLQPLVLGGMSVGGSTGLVITAPDPDGEGRIALFTGDDAAGMFQGLSVPVDLTKDTWLLVRARKVLRRGEWPLLPTATFRTDRPRVVRLDGPLWEVLASSADGEGDDGLALAVRRVGGFGDFFGAALGPNRDLFSFYRRLLHADRELLESTRACFEDVDLEVLILALEAKARELLGPRPGPAPLVVFLVGDPRGTNAMTFDPDPVTGRPRVVLNLAAYRSVATLSISVAHELVHTFQAGADASLRSRAVREGVAVLVSGELVPSAREEELLMWPTESLAAAEARRSELIVAFRQDADLPADQCPGWLVLGRPSEAVPGAPDRSAYYVGLLAARAWRRAHGGSLAELLRANPRELLGALD